MTNYWIQQRAIYLLSQYTDHHISEAGEELYRLINKCGFIFLERGELQGYSGAVLMLPNLRRTIYVGSRENLLNRLEKYLAKRVTDC